MRVGPGDGPLVQNVHVTQAYLLRHGCQLPGVRREPSGRPRHLAARFRFSFSFSFSFFVFVFVENTVKYEAGREKKKITASRNEEGKTKTEGNKKRPVQRKGGVGRTETIINSSVAS